MTLEEFTKLIKDNMTVFEKDYLQKRTEHPNPDDAYPLTLTPELWFAQLSLWHKMIEILGDSDIENIYQENELDEDGSIEFKLDGWEDDD